MDGANVIAHKVIFREEFRDAFDSVEGSSKKKRTHQERSKDSVQEALPNPLVCSLRHRGFFGMGTVRREMLSRGPTPWAEQEGPRHQDAGL